jgi:hypothetical protein
MCAAIHLASLHVLRLNEFGHGNLDQGDHVNVELLT